MAVLRAYTRAGVIRKAVSCPIVSLIVGIGVIVVIACVVACVLWVK